MIEARPLKKEDMNHYPIDLFPEISKQTIQHIHLVLMKEFGMPLDTLSAHIMRKSDELWKERVLGLVEWLKQEIQKEDIKVDDEICTCREDEIFNNGIQAGLLKLIGLLNEGVKQIKY